MSSRRGAKKQDQSKKERAHNTRLAKSAPSVSLGADAPEHLPQQDAEKTHQEERQEELREFAHGLREANQERKRLLTALAVADHVAAAPGLAFCRALDAAYAGDEGKTVKHLGTAAKSLAVALDVDADEEVEAVA